MALIHCSECGKEISSLATACPSCGAPPPSSIVPPPLPMRARPVSPAKRFFLGTLTVLTGAALVWAIRGLTHQPSTPSAAAASPTPATAESGSSPPIEMALQRSGSPAPTQTPTAESATTSSRPVETVSQSSPITLPAETPIAESPATSSPPIETVSENSPSPAAAETPSVSDASVATAPPPRATYQVVGVDPGDYLYVRAGAGSDYQVVTKLEPGTGGILLGAKRVVSGATTWQEISANGQTGWVNAAYIAPASQMPASPTESPTAP
jgi:Bacterial SH3 domain/zinc-ribbon domain